MSWRQWSGIPIYVLAWPFLKLGLSSSDSEAGDRPDELLRLAIVLTGPRSLPGWQKTDAEPMDFYDLKGIIATLMDGLHIHMQVEPIEHPTFHPGKCARIMVGEQQVGVFGELHPLVHEHYDFSSLPVIAADINLDLLISMIPEHYAMQPVPAYPPVLEDLAIVVDDDIPAERVAECDQASWWQDSDQYHPV